MKFDATFYVVQKIILSAQCDIHDNWLQFLLLFHFLLWENISFWTPLNLHELIIAIFCVLSWDLNRVLIILISGLYLALTFVKSFEFLILQVVLID